MADRTPQKEDGYVAIANEIFDKMIAFRMPGEVRQVVDCIIRKTYGYNKPEDWISESQFVAMTGKQRQNVWRSVKTAIEHKIAIRSDDKKKLRLNKNLEEWISFGVQSEVITNKLQSEVMHDAIRSDADFAIRSDAHNIQQPINKRQGKSKNVSHEIKASLSSTLIAYYTDVTRKPCRTTDARVKKIDTLSKRYSVEEMKTAIDHFQRSEFHSGRDGKWNNGNFDWIFGSETNFVKMLELEPQKNLVKQQFSKKAEPEGIGIDEFVKDLIT